MNKILLILHMFSFQVAVSQPLYKNEKFENPPGVYFEKDLLTIRSPIAYWKVINYVDYGTLIVNHIILESNLKQINTECRNFEEACPAQIHLNLLLNKMHSLEDSLNHIHELIGHRIKRSAPFEFIGSISKALFGTLTSEDARYYGNLITQVSTDNMELSRLLANQTQIVKSEFGQLEQHFSKIDSNLEQIHHELDALKTITSQLARKEKQFSLYFRFQEVVILLDQAITSFESDVNVLVDGIMFAKQGLIHPKLVTPDQLIRSLEEIKAVLPYAEFPSTTLVAHADDFIKASEITVSFFNNKLVIVMEVPLLTHTKYNLYTVHTLPIHRAHSNLFQSIQPQIKKMIVSQSDDAYYIVNPLVPLNCKVIKNQRICKSLSPMRRIREKDVCEINLLLNRPETENCRFEVMERNESYWMPLQEKGKWLYSILATESCKVMCSNEEDHFLLKGAGVISLPPGCTIRTNTISLMNEGVMSHSETYLYVPQVELNLDTLFKQTVGETIVSFDTAASEAISDSKDSWRAEAVSVSLSEIIEKAKEIGNGNLIMHQPINNGHFIIGLGAITSIIMVIFALCRYKVLIQFISHLFRTRKNLKAEKRNEGLVAVTSV